MSSEKGPRNLGRSGPYHTEAALLALLLPFTVRRMVDSVRCTLEAGVSRAGAGGKKKTLEKTEGRADRAESGCRAARKATSRWHR